MTVILIFLFIFASKLVIKFDMMKEINRKESFVVPGDYYRKLERKEKGKSEKMSLLFPKKPIVKSVDCGLSSEKGLFAWLCLILFDCQMTYMQNIVVNKVTR